MLRRVLNIELNSDKKKLLGNFFSLLILQAINYILPLITLPYLIRVLGPEKFGLISFAQAFIQYFNILTDYGFHLSATREVSIHRENREKVSEVFSSVMIIKFTLLILSLVIITIVIFSFEKFKRNWQIYYLAFGTVIGRAILPVWFFQGMERMKYITFLNAISKLIFTVSIFVFIRETSDYIYVPLLNSLGFLASGFLAIWIVIKNFDIRIYVPRLRILIAYLKDSTQFFLSRVSVSIYTSTNTFVLGLFTNNKIVGYYSIAEKLYIALQQFYYPLVNALYPYVAHKKNIRVYMRILRFSILINIVIVFILFVTSNHIIGIIFGTGLEESIKVFRVLLLSALIVIPSMLLGYPFLAALGFTSYANLSVIIGSILHLLGLGILTVLGIINIYSVAFMVIITETFVLIIRLYGVIKHRLWRVS